MWVALGINVAMLVGTGAVAWFTAPMGITAVAVGVAVGQFVALLAGLYFLLRRLVGVPMRESLGEGAAALACSGALVLAVLPAADLHRPSLGPLPLTLCICSLGLAVYVACLRIVSPSAWGDLRSLFVRVLGARRLLRTTAIGSRFSGSKLPDASP